MRSTRFGGLRVLILATIALCTASAADAQRLQRPYKNTRARVSYRMPSGLEQIPVDPGRGEPHLVDKWSATKKPLYGKFGTYEWQAEVKVFAKEAPKTQEKKESEEEQKEEEEESLREAVERFNTYRNYGAWLVDYKQRAKFDKKGEEKKQRRGKKLPYRFYEYRENEGRTTWITCAACYDLKDREVVISVYFPEEFHKKLYRMVQASLLSVKEIEVEDEDTSFSRIYGAKHANTPARKKALEEAIEGVKAVKGWDLFATEHFIVVYSFESNSGKKRQRYNYAKKLARYMDGISSEYQELLPPHKNMKRAWSVLRICKAEEEFHKYGDTQPGVAGWFNRLSKELVMYDRPKASGMSTETVAFHEGFHQYADAWFGDARMHIWFNEGFADYFGSMGRAGRRWIPGKVQPRKKQLLELVEQGRTIPCNEIVRWSQVRFYSGEATNHYAQAWAMIDFMTRGKSSRYWKKEWDDILSTYISTLRKTEDREAAREAAFKGMKWDEFEEAWANYVKNGL